MSRKRTRKQQWRSGDFFAIPASETASLLGQVIAHEGRGQSRGEGMVTTGPRMTRGVLIHGRPRRSRGLERRARPASPPRRGLQRRNDEGPARPDGRRAHFSRRVVRRGQSLGRRRLATSPRRARGFSAGRSRAGTGTCGQSSGTAPRRLCTRPASPSTPLGMRRPVPRCRAPRAAA